MVSLIPVVKQLRSSSNVTLVDVGAPTGVKKKRRGMLQVNPLSVGFRRSRREDPQKPVHNASEKKVNSYSIRGKFRKYKASLSWSKNCPRTVYARLNAQEKGQVS